MRFAPSLSPLDGLLLHQPLSLINCLTQLFHSVFHFSSPVCSNLLLLPPQVSQRPSMSHCISVTPVTPSASVSVPVSVSLSLGLPSTFSVDSHFHFICTLSAFHTSYPMIHFPLSRLSHLHSLHIWPSKVEGTRVNDSQCWVVTELNNCDENEDKFSNEFTSSHVSIRTCPRTQEW